MAYPTPSPDVLEAASDLSTPFPAIPAAEHRTQVREALAKAGIESGVVYLRGDVTAERHHTDVEVMFRQESNFLYVTGCEEPGYHYLLDVASGESFLFAPVVELDEAVWIGMPPSLEDQTETYGLPVLGGVPALQEKLAELDPAAVYVLDIESNYEALGEEFAARVAKEVATEALTNARLRKTEGEAALIRRANAISHRAHVAVMRAASLATSETALEALFRYTCHKHGAKQQAYLPIIGAGANAATLHYGRNLAPLATAAASPHALVLVDAGCEVRGYASDITRTFPAQGTFTDEARHIYQTVLNTQIAVIEQLRPGVQWEDMHRVAERVIAEGLIEAGILVGDIEDVLAAHAQAVFLPHGLGHLLGLDVHDVGGYPKGTERIPEPSIRYLRMRRALEPGMVVTVEPGIYFTALVIENAKNDETVAPFIDFEVVERYMPVGGVRIEDNILITEDGYLNLTDVPKTVEEIEAIMADAA
ncbi:hypothetical protein GGF32_005962 [Allomyces javanicus]|nr:hypothetical protein GGF32_005962 [Allomyces javanicus]